MLLILRVLDPIILQSRGKLRPKFDLLCMRYVCNGELATYFDQITVGAPFKSQWDMRVPMKELVSTYVGVDVHIV